MTRRNRTFPSDARSGAAKADPGGAAEPGFDDSGWQSVSLPHTYNDVEPPARTRKVSDRYLFTFPETAFAPGELKAVACSGGKTVATHSLHTAGAPVALRMTTVAGAKGLQADGSDVVLIDVEAVDAKGDRCPTFQKRVDF